MRSWPHLPPLRSVPLTDEALSGADAVVVVTDHTAVDWARVGELAPLIVDTRGVFRRPSPKVVKA
jgi:UDP-N-acetyl-D-glucosamine dehydrogenase